MTSMGSPRVREATRKLQHAITSGRWPVGSRIPTETDLSAELDVGRSTVREAVRSLAHLGMLEPAAGRGTFVRSLNPIRGVLSDFAADHSWRDILAVRRALEIQAASLAAARCDEAGLARLRAAHDSDPSLRGAAPGADGPGQFHATLVDLADNRLLVELHSSLLQALRRGIGSGEVCHGLDPAQRRLDHEALLGAIAAGNPIAAAAVAAAHADHDLLPAT